jgi:general secretion pathway protein M
MRPLWDSLVGWWDGLSARERRLLAILGAVTALLAAWYGLLAPLNRLAAEERLHHAQAAAALTEAEALSGALTRIERMRAGAGRPGAAAEHVRAAAGAAGVGILREQPEPGGGASVWTEPVAAKALFAWLSLLQSEYGVEVRGLEVHRSEQPGLLDVRASFAGAGT